MKMIISQRMSVKFTSKMVNILLGLQRPYQLNMSTSSVSGLEGQISIDIKYWGIFVNWSISEAIRVYILINCPISATLKLLQGNSNILHLGHLWIALRCWYVHYKDIWHCMLKHWQCKRKKISSFVSVKFFLGPRIILINPNMFFLKMF